MNLDKIKQQAIAILRQEQRDREARPAVDGPIIVSSAEFVRDFELKPRKQPLRAWAELAATYITEPQWQDMVWSAADTVTPFKGDAIRFFETAFEGVTLKDGSTIWA